MWQRHGEKEGCRDERDAELKKIKEEEPGSIAYCILY